MKRYENRSGRGGITGYEILFDRIILEFSYEDEICMIIQNLVKSMWNK